MTPETGAEEEEKLAVVSLHQFGDTLVSTGIVQQQQLQQRRQNVAAALLRLVLGQNRVQVWVMSSDRPGHSLETRI